MNIRPKTARRLMVLAMGFAIVAAAAVVLYQTTQARMQRELEATLKQGLDAFAREDYAAALDALKQVVRRQQDDFDTVFAYAKSRAKVPTGDRSHIAEAIQLFRLRVLPLKPDHSESQDILLDLYAQAGFNTEANELADQVLRRNPSDPLALKTRAIALCNLRQYEQALTATEKWCAAAPKSELLEANLLLFDLQLQLQQSRDAMVSRAADLREKHPDEASFEVLQAIAYAYANNRREALHWLDTAAARPNLDAELLRRIVRAYDGYGFFDRSQAVLEKHADNPALHPLYVQRIWQNGQYEQVVQRLATLDPADQKSDSHLLALRAISLFQLKRDSEALPIVEALDQRSEEPAALAWATALKVRFVEKNLTQQERITRLAGAVQRDPSNAVVRYLLGESYALVGENELALAAWRQAALDAGSWAAPHLTSADVLLRTNRLDGAVAAANEAVKRAPQQPSVITFLAAVRFELLEQTKDPAQAEKLMQIVKSVQDSIPGEPDTLPIYVTLLARSGQPDQAIVQIDQAIGKQASNQDLMIALADVSRLEKLGAEARIFAAIEQAHGITATTAYARATQLHAQGKSAQGLQELLQAASTAPKDKALAWQLAEARYRELIGDPGAPALWKTIAESNPDNVVVQTTVLEDAASAWTDRALIVATIERLQKLTPPEGRSWKLYRAELLLDEHNGRVPTDAEASEAMQILSELVRESPRLVKSRLLLARAYAGVRNPARAIDQLREAHALRPDSTAITLELIRLLQNDSRYDEARPLLAALIRDNPTDREVQREAAELLVAQGDLQAGLDTLLKLRSGQPSADPKLDSMIAELYLTLGKPADAKAIYDKLIADSEITDPTIIESAAEFYAVHGDAKATKIALERLRTIPLAPGELDLIQGNLADRHGTAEAALMHYESAVKAAPQDARTWRALASFHLRRAQYAKGIEAVERGLKAIPGNSDLTSLRATATALASSAQDPNNASLQPMINALAQDPANRPAFETMKVLQEARTAKLTPEQTVERLRELADQYPRFEPLQSLVIDYYIALDKASEASKIALRTMEAMPSSAVAAQLSVKTAMAAQNWTEALVAAKEWRARSLNDPVAADLVIAELHVRLKQPALAVSQLQAYIDVVRKNPDANSAILAAYAQALILSNRASEAQALIEPLTVESSVWRRVWLTAMVPHLTDLKMQVEWIERITPAVTSSPDEQLALAQAWYSLAERTADQSTYEKARKLLEPLTKGDNPSIEAVKMLAVSLHHLGDLAAAEVQYRRVLKAEPDVRMMNNLAYLLYLRGGDLTEAQSFATQAVQASPNDPNFRDTLARIESKLGHTDLAVTHFEAALKGDPENLEIWIGLAQTLTKAGRREQAKPILERIDALLRSNPALSKDLEAQLQDARAALEGN